MTSTPGPKVLLVAGWGRSGSTLIGEMLGQAGGCIHVGEVRGIWGHMQPGSTSRCGCGKPHHRCPFWTEVFSRAFPGESSARFAELEEVQAERFRMRPATSWSLRRELHSDSSSSALSRYAGLLARLYSQIAAVSGDQLIIDSSKTPGHARLVAELVEAPTYVLHLVRDPRAIAFSWQRRSIYGRRFGPLSSSFAWLAANLLSASLLRELPDQRSKVLRYEDFVADPQSTIESVSRWLDLSVAGLRWLDDQSILLEPNHTIAGNPSRFVTGAVTIRPDDEWKSSLGAGSSIAATLPALPLLRRYGYPIRPGASLSPAATGMLIRGRSP
jgi:sulfotransferase family protein